MGEGLAQDFGRGQRGVEALDEGALDAEENLAHCGERFRAFEVIGRIAPRGDPAATGGGFKVEEQYEVGCGRECFVGGKNGVRVSAAGALIGGGGKVVAVEDDDLARSQCGVDERVDMFGAILDEEFEFLL